MHPMKSKKVPGKSVERLSIYRRVLADNHEGWTGTVFSHDLGQACQLTAAQVRRDLMAVGYRGNPNKGYDVQGLLAAITRYLDPTLPREVAIVGMGHLGRAISKFLEGRSRKLHLAAAFDSEPCKAGLVFSGVTCYTVDRMPEIVREKGIDLGVLTVPAEHAQSAAMRLVAAGVTGILNFAPVVLRVPPTVYAESIDMSVALGKVAFFARPSNRQRKVRPARQPLIQPMEALAAF
jgi:redox-sensing transcriptional repressor